MTAPAPTACRVCDGDQVVVLERNGTDIPVPCPQCCCLAGCGRPAIAPGDLCQEHDDESFVEYDRRAERRADA